VLLAGSWPSSTTVTGADAASVGPGGLTIEFNANGNHSITITP
jgi:hypothetical protein